MKIIETDPLCTTTSRLNTPGGVVAAGEHFIVKTALASGGWLHSAGDRFDLEKFENVRRVGTNPTAVVEVQGAQPGSILAVSIHDVRPGKLGYTGFDESYHRFAWRVSRRAFGTCTKTVRIQDGMIQWSDRIRIPIAPMIGTLGVAPVRESISNMMAGYYGGNMDCQEVCPGTTVYLPVFVPGALLHVGDTHAIQGDGEINDGGGIECCAKVELSVQLLDGPPSKQCIRMQNDEYIMSVAINSDVREAFAIVVSDLMDWMETDYSFDPDDAYLLMGQLLKARATQAVNSFFTYIGKMPKRCLEGQRD
jgi:amidase